MSNSNNKEKYNDIPLIYCKSCLSLIIDNYNYNPEDEELEEGVLDEDDFCGSCGSTDIGICTIEEYQELYKNKYGEEFLKFKDNGKKSRNASK